MHCASIDKTHCTVAIIIVDVHASYKACTVADSHQLVFYLHMQISSMTQHKQTIKYVSAAAEFGA